ncbi:hypothetical protein GALMADRAFT_141768 [Galerina marginata CBS 339.88]|uniref:Reverse transcriptase domain-containing protein n=1 Tax=Galerina marginata (strain CBS 339.88) TaxID=685588 RepID=A0A067T281_GALM3|nr:hypothetical protein GALMADRAFT_141768 [Galerina marginata CBS 339.88]
MSATASTTSAKSSFGQTLQFITDIKLQELEKQRLAYQSHAKVLDRAQALGEAGEILQKVEVLAKAVKSWTGSGALDYGKIVGGKLQLTNLEFWLLQAKNDPSFSREIAEGWADTLEEHIRHTIMRFDSAKLFGNLFNEWLASGDSVALAYQAGPADAGEDNASDSDGTGSEFVEVGRKEMYEQKEKLMSIVFEDHPVDVDELNAYLEDIFSSEEATKSLEKLRTELKTFGYWLQRRPLTVREVKNAIHGLLTSGLMDEEKRTTLKAFQENPTVLQEVASVLNMRMASIESWAWPKEGILVEFRRHLNGKYRAFTDPEIIDALLLHHIGVSWQVKLKQALTRLFDSKAWIRPALPSHEVRQHRIEQLRRDHGKASIQAEREKNQRALFFLTQLQANAARPKPYDDLLDAPPPEATADATVGPALIKQKLLHIMTTECYLNTALHGTHATVCSDLEWFGPSLPHTTILTVLEFMGMSKAWISFYKAFLSAPIRFPGESEARVRKRGTPISYSLSVLCGEAVIFMMDFAVNQRANGLFLHRMHDDLWLWDADAKKVAAGWEEMKKYTELVGLKINQKKTGSSYVGPRPEDAAGLPRGDIRWGFLKFDPEESRFVIDQADIDHHIVEMRRQLASTKSVFGWVNTYNKYMAFFLRNLGGIPANCFGKAHITGMIDTLARIQRDLFSDVGGAVGYLRRTIEDRFGVVDLPEGYFYFPIGSGGLELRNVMLELLALERRGQPLVTWGERPADIDDGADNSDEPREDLTAGSDEYFLEYKAMAEDKFPKRIEHDYKAYAELKEAWEQNRDNLRRKTRWDVTDADKKKEEFMSFEEYTSLRESWLSSWGNSYLDMLGWPAIRPVALVPKVQETLALTSSRKDWNSLDWYAQWVVSMYGEEVVRKFGGLEAVDPNLIPVGMVQLFRTSRIKLDQ